MKLLEVLSFVRSRQAFRHIRYAVLTGYCNLNLELIACIYSNISLFSVTAEDAGSGDDPGFKGLIRYWKKHGIPIPQELLSDMADEKGNL